jgi:hypothetical protein
VIQESRTGRGLIQHDCSAAVCPLTKPAEIPTGLMIAHGTPGLAACESVTTPSTTKRAKDQRSILHKLAIQCTQRLCPNRVVVRLFQHQHIAGGMADDRTNNCSSDI